MKKKKIKTAYFCYNFLTEKIDIYTDHAYSIDYKFFFEELMNVANVYSKIFVRHLSMYYRNIICDLFESGYDDLTPIQDDISIKRDEPMSMVYTVGHDKGCYKIKIIVSKKHSCIIYNADMKIPLEDDVFNECFREFKTDNMGSVLKNACERIKSSTISGEAMRIFGVANICLENSLEHFIEYDDGETDSHYQYIYPSYRGGFNMLNPEYENENIGAGYVIDANSLYPFVMATELYPVGFGEYEDGKPDFLDGYCYILRINAKFKIKPGCIPFLTEKTENIFEVNQPVIDSRVCNRDGEILDDYMELTLTKPDYDLFMEMYDVEDIEYIDYLVFRGSKSLFVNYVRSLKGRKENAKNKGERTIAKFLLNGLSGKMGGRDKYDNATFKYILREEDICFDMTVSRDNKQGSFIQVGAYILAYARCMIVKLAMKLGGLNPGSRWIYSDTDSLHILGDLHDIEKYGIELDQNKLGKFKIEHHFDKAAYFGLKRYVIYEKGSNRGAHAVFAGLQTIDRLYLEECIDYILDEDFDGASFVCESHPMFFFHIIPIPTRLRPDRGKDKRPVHTIACKTDKYCDYKSAEVKNFVEAANYLYTYGLKGLCGCKWYRHYYVADETYRLRVTSQSMTL